jgi:hypothetical protein
MAHPAQIIRSKHHRACPSGMHRNRIRLAFRRDELTSMDYAIAAPPSLIDDNQFHRLTRSSFPGAIYQRINRHVNMSS